MHVPLALWNGEMMPLEDVKVPVLDRGWLFGDAVYEVIRLYGGRPFLLDEHARRLARSLEGLGIPHRTSTKILGDQIARLVSGGGAPDSLVYVQISRGAGPRSHVPAAGMVPNELVYVAPVDDAPLEAKRQRGIGVALVLDKRWGRCDLKTVNLLGNVLAAEDARRVQADEALLVDERGFITEGTHASFFAVRNGELLTTPLSERILPGITRAFVMDVARREGLTVRETRVASRDVAKLDEAFLSGTISEVMPIVRVDGQALGSGVVGPQTQRLLGALKDAAYGK